MVGSQRSYKLCLKNSRPWENASPDDIAVIHAIVQAGKLLDVEVLDHLIIGQGKWVSLKERGLGFA